MVNVLINNALGYRRRGGVPGILSGVNTVAWFDSAIQYITKDGSDFVSQWNDRSSNTNHLLQAVGTNQPLWTADGVLFDGIDNEMDAAFALIQPEFIYIVLKQVTWTDNEYIIDGITSDTGLLRQITSTPNIGAYAGVVSAENTNLPVDTFGIVRLLFNGASSKLQVNETAAVVGDFGTIDMGGITLGNRAGGTSYSNIQVKEAILRDIADTAPNEQIIYDYLAAKYSIS